MMQEINSEILRQIQEQIEKIKNDTGIESDELSQKELDEFFGLNTEEINELDKEILDIMRRQPVEVEILDEGAVFPSYNYPTDSGFDLHSTINLTLPPLGRAIVPTGLKLGFDAGFEVQIRTKSGLAINKGLMVLNSPGTVDAGYTGEIKVIVFNASNETIEIERGMKVAQAVLCPVMNGKFVMFNSVATIKEKDRGDKGFGSTGLK